MKREILPGLRNPLPDLQVGVTRYMMVHSSCLIACFYHRIFIRGEYTSGYSLRIAQKFESVYSLGNCVVQTALNNSCGGGVGVVRAQ